MHSFCFQGAYNQWKKKISEKSIRAIIETNTRALWKHMEGVLTAIRSDFELSQYKVDLSRGSVWVGYQFLAQLWYHLQIRECRKVYRIKLGVKVT